MTDMTPIRTVKSAPKSQLIPLNKLFVSKLNVRKHGPLEIDTLAASIAAKGLLQPLLVRPSGKQFEVIFGQRRMRALQKLGAAKHPGADRIECIVREMDDATAIAASLAENIERLPMDVMDQYEAFANLAKAGQDEAAIASHFGITRQTVKRRLALGRLIPDVRKLYRDGRIEEKELQLLTLAPKEKQKEYAALASDPKGNPPPPWQLKAWLLGGSEIATRAALFPLESYKAPIAADLFGNGKYFTDPQEFWRLQNEAIAAHKASLEASGWTVELFEPSTPPSMSGNMKSSPRTRADARSSPLPPMARSRSTRGSFTATSLPACRRRAKAWPRRAMPVLTTRRLPTKPPRPNAPS